MNARHLAQWYLLVFGFVFLATSGARLYSFLHERSDIWWTPPTMKAPLAESAERVQIYVHDTELQDLLGAGRVQLAAAPAPPGATTLVAADVALRFNNWDRVRAERLPGMLVTAATAGSAATLLLLGVVLWSRRRPEV
ncbi:MAG TPA: hypothetical protein VLV16_06035 [Gemmatimonadales bacterium]|nr:hypothetical protein [Gemmatimonadales bacterium]